MKFAKTPRVRRLAVAAIAAPLLALAGTGAAQAATPMAAHHTTTHHAASKTMTSVKPTAYDYGYGHHGYGHSYDGYDGYDNSYDGYGHSR
jgi:hypothetical protein